MGALSISSGRFTSGQPDLWYVPRIRQAIYPLVIFQTGGSDTAATSNILGARPTLAELVRCGFCVVQPAAGPWGAATAMARMDDALTWGRANLGCTANPPVVIGTSNGGVASLQYARQHDVAACVTFIAPVDVNYIRDNDLVSARATIDAAWGVVYPAALPAHADIITDGASYTPSKLQAWTSSNDVLNDPTSTQQAFFQGIGADWHNLGAVGHDYASMDTVDPSVVRDFVLARV